MVWLRKGLILRVRTVEYPFPLFRIFHKVLMDILKAFDLTSPIELPVDIRPLIIGNPFSWIIRDSDLSSWS